MRVLLGSASDLLDVHRPVHRLLQSSRHALFCEKRLVRADDRPASDPCVRVRSSATGSDKRQARLALNNNDSHLHLEPGSYGKAPKPERLISMETTHE
jgi:hypothetical protein